MELWALEAHEHKTTYGPMIYMGLYIMFLMRANPLLGQGGGGLALGIRLFWAKMALASLLFISESQKVEISRAQPPPLALVMDLLVQNITNGAV